MPDQYSQGCLKDRLKLPHMLQQASQSSVRDADFTDKWMIARRSALNGIPGPCGVCRYRFCEAGWTLVDSGLTGR
jgi:hypothetical protein